MNTNAWDRVIGSLVRGNGSRRGDRGQAEFSSGEGKNRAGESEGDQEGDNWKVLHGEEVKEVKKNVMMTGVSVEPVDTLHTGVNCRGWATAVPIG